MRTMHDEDREIIQDILDNILWALDQVQKRFRVIHSPDDFLDSDNGLEKLSEYRMEKGHGYERYYYSSLF